MVFILEGLFMAGTSGTKEIRTSYPFTSGLTAGTTSQTGRVENLTPELGSNVQRKNKTGISGL